MPIIQYGQIDSNIETLFRVTENEDLRVTEDDNIRITNEAGANAILALLVATATLVKLDANFYIKVNDVWEPVVPYLKHDGLWKEANAIYVKQSGTWLRTY